jgi:hypothetical protein
VVGGRDPGDIADVAENLPGDDVPNAVDGGQGGAGGGQGLAGLGLVRRQLTVQTADVVEQIARQVAATYVGGGERPDAA